MSLRSMPIIRGADSGPTAVVSSTLFHGKQLNWNIYFTRITIYNRKIMSSNQKCHKITEKSSPPKTFTWTFMWLTSWPTASNQSAWWNFRHHTLFGTFREKANAIIQKMQSTLSIFQ